jgi:UDP-glucose:(heptosyl)LPS alpha-1,3-glucosyltransferase
VVQRPKVAILKQESGKHGGLEKQTRRLLEEFHRRGYETTLVAPPLRKKIGFQRILEFDAFCTDYLQQYPHEIVLGMDRTRSQTHLRAGNGVHAAYLKLRTATESLWKSVSFSVNPLHRTLLEIEKEAFESPTLRALVVNSYLVKEQLLEFYSTPPDKIHVVHNGVEWDEMGKDFTPWPEEREKLLKRLSLSPSDYHFLFVGHNFQRKGLKFLLDALAALPSRDFHLSIIGEDKRRKAYEEYAASLGLGKSVSFFGTLFSPRPFYQMADALVIPSVYDPFANVTLEALAMGLFVISSKTNGGYEVVTSESGVVLNDLQDREEFVRALERAMQRPKKNDGALAIRHTVQSFDFSRQLGLLCNVCTS